jgi:two-component system OmpR family response regulator
LSLEVVPHSRPIDHDPELARRVELVTLTDTEHRARLAAAGRPRIVVVPADDPAPFVVDELEDWIREPVDDRELAVRVAILEARAVACRREVPVVDAEGLVWFGNAWISLPHSQRGIARRLVESYGAIVPLADIAVAARAAGASDHPEALKAAVARVRGRMSALGLVVHTVRARGYLLDASGD